MIVVLLGLDIVGNTLCWIRMNIFCVSSRRNGPLDSSEYEFLNITICFHWCRTQKQSLTPAWYSLFVRSFVFFFDCCSDFGSIGIWFLYFVGITKGRRTATHADYFRHQKKYIYHSLAPATDKISHATLRQGENQNNICVRCADTDM